MYDYSEQDPSKSRALESSLWELQASITEQKQSYSSYSFLTHTTQPFALNQALKQHYYPDVVRLSTILETSLSKEPYDIEEFMNQNTSMENYKSRNNQPEHVVLDLMRSDVGFGKNIWKWWKFST